MMWNKAIFLGKFIGTIFLALMSIFAIVCLGFDKLNIDENKRNIFNPIMIGLVLIASIIICLLIETHVHSSQNTGFLKPDFALMMSIANSNHDLLIPSIAEEFGGALIGGIISFGLFLLVVKNNEQVN